MAMLPAARGAVRHVWRPGLPSVYNIRAKKAERTDAGMRPWKSPRAHIRAEGSGRACASWGRVV